MRFETLTRYTGLAAGDDEPVVRLAREASGIDATGAISFGSEGGLFAAAGIPAVVCGPGRMDQGHKPDEHVTRAGLRDCLAFLAALGGRLAQGLLG